MILLNEHNNAPDFDFLVKPKCKFDNLAILCIFVLLCLSDAVGTSSSKIFIECIIINVFIAAVLWIGSFFVKRASGLYVRKNTLTYKNKTFSNEQIAHVICSRRGCLKFYPKGSDNKAAVAKALMSDENAQLLVEWIRFYKIP